MRLFLSAVLWYPIANAIQVAAQTTNTPAPAITGVEAIDSLIHASPIVLVAIVIQLIGAAIFKTEWIPNKALPVINLVLGGAAYPAAIGNWNFKNVLLGVLAGAGATGVYEVFKTFRPGGEPPANPKPDAIPTHPPTPNP